MALKTKAIFSVLAALLSAGCAGAPGETVYLRPKAPARLLDCPARPEPPAEAATQRSVAVYLIDLAAAHAACRDRLRALRRLIDPIPAHP